MNPINLEEFLSGINKRNIFINQLENIKEYIKDPNEKYFIKINDKKSIEREYNAIRFFSQYKTVEVPKIIFHNQNIIITHLEEGLKENSLSDISDILYNLHKEFLFTKDLEIGNFLLGEYYSRDNILKNFNKNTELIRNYINAPLVKRIISDEDEKILLKIPKVICHGDTHLNNIKKNKYNKPFLLDLEYSHYNNVTFDLSTHIFSHPENMENIMDEYFEKSKDVFLNKISKEEMIKFVLKDTLRICSYDLIKNVNDPNKKDRIEYDLLLINKILEKI